MENGFLLWKVHNACNEAMLWMANALIRPLKAGSAKRLAQDVKSGRIRRVLLDMPDGIGDAVVTAPFARALSREFGQVTVLSSQHNDFVYREERVRTRLAPSDLFGSRELRTLMLAAELLRLPSGMAGAANQWYDYDLIIDLGGHVRIKTYYRAKYTVGQNKGSLSLFYDSFTRRAFTMPGSPTISQGFCDLARECLGLTVQPAESLPRGFLKRKKRQVFILVGGKSGIKDLPYGKWKALALAAARHGKCVIADGPEQQVMARMAADAEISGNRNITLVRGRRSLPDLARIANRSALFIAVDGGGQHYLERYTNSIAIYTCTAPNPWLPYSKNPYAKFRLPAQHVLESTVDGNGLYKAGFYRIEKRYPYYGFFFKVAKKEMVEKLDVRLLKSVIAKALRAAKR